ncbi:MAG: hypothetical protein JWP51_3668 [Bradyrhizobium sp.]|nr:hypothetical protein [Bradyrhizobium sp.]
MILRGLNPPAIGVGHVHWKMIPSEPLRPPTACDGIPYRGRQFHPAPCGATSPLRRAFASSQADDARRPDGKGIPSRDSEPGRSFPRLQPARPPTCLPSDLRPISRQCHYDSERSLLADSGTCRSLRAHTLAASPDYAREPWPHAGVMHYPIKPHGEAARGGRGHARVPCQASKSLPSLL